MTVDQVVHHPSAHVPADRPHCFIYFITIHNDSEREVTIIDAFEAVGACARGLMSREDVDAIERAICPGEGS